MFDIVLYISSDDKFKVSEFFRFWFMSYKFLKIEKCSNFSHGLRPLSIRNSKTIDPRQLKFSPFFRALI